MWQDKPYDNKSDMWSLGCVMYELVSLNPPFQAKDMKGLYNRVMKGAYPKIPSHYSASLSDVISSLLKVDPKKRPTCEEIMNLPVFLERQNDLTLQN